MIDLFTEFKWAVPKAFAPALRDCRFEQGDRLYDTAEAYEGYWKDAQSHLKYSIEILSPPRGQVVQTIKKYSASEFASNWLSEVELVVTHHKEKGFVETTTTQGRLYSLLWIGDLSVLLEIAEPSMPAKSLVIPETTEEEIFHFKSKTAGRACSMFLSPFDETNDIFVGKSNQIRNALKDTCGFEFYKERPHVVYGKDVGEFVPTLYVGCYVIDSTDKNRIEAAFKKALYVPVKNKITDRENWNLTKHGQLVQVGI